LLYQTELRAHALYSISYVLRQELTFHSHSTFRKKTPLYGDHFVGHDTSVFVEHDLRFEWTRYNPALICA
jgi:hypothetical protein